MKAKSLKPKAFFIPCADGKKTLLAPAAPMVEIPDNADFTYLKSLADNGMVAVDGEFPSASVEKEDPLALLKAEYEALAGKPADGRWSEDKLKEKIKELSQPDDAEETE